MSKKHRTNEVAATNEATAVETVVETSVETIEATTQELPVEANELHESDMANEETSEAPSEATPPAVIIEPPKPIEQPKVEMQSFSVENTKDGSRAGELITAFGNKSKAIRALREAGWETGDIAKALKIRYQHARNVLNQPLKRNAA